MNTIGALPPAYAAALLSATSDALDAGVFYQDAFETFVLDRIGRADPAHDQFLGVFDEPSRFQQRSALRSVVQSQVVQAPRGSWAVISHDGRDPGARIYLPVMSDGSNAPATGGSFDVYEEMPGYSAIHRRMAGYEVYLARKQVEAERSRAHNLPLIVEGGFRVGTTYRLSTIGRETYSTVTITALHPVPSERLTIVGADDRGDGWLSLGMIKRGSRYRFRVDLAAAMLAASIDAANRRKEETQSVASLLSPACSEHPHGGPS